MKMTLCLMVSTSSRAALKGGNIRKVENHCVDGKAH